MSLKGGKVEGEERCVTGPRICRSVGHFSDLQAGKLQDQVSKVLRDFVLRHVLFIPIYVHGNLRFE